MVVHMQRFLIDTPTGQVNVRKWPARSRTAARPLICLHPCPYSGAYFQTLAGYLDSGRDVYAPDYPGYGGSDPLSATPAIGDYARAVGAAIAACAEPGQQVDFLGFHTGCLVAADLAIAYPDLVTRVIMIDVPYYSAQDQAERYPVAAKPPAYDAEFESLRAAWEFTVAKRVGSMPFDRAFDNFVEQLRAGKNAHIGFHAAFTYDCAGQFRKISHDMLIIATQSPLRAATLAAHEHLPQAKFIDHPEITRAVMEEGAAIIAADIAAFC
jgi:pimeloyl-ACP methyl ester carboxylesterase